MGASVRYGIQQGCQELQQGTVGTLALPGAQERLQIGGDVLPGSRRGWAWARTEGIYCCSLAQLCLALLWPHRLQQARLLCPWDFPDKNTGVGSHFLPQRIFPTQGRNPCPLHWQADSLSLSHQWSPMGHITEGLKCQSTAALNAEGSWEVGRGSTMDFSLEMGGEKSWPFKGSTWQHPVSME